MKALISMRKAIESPAILGSAFPRGSGGDSWIAWRAMAIAAMGEPLTAPELAAFRKLTNRQNSPAERVEELVIVKGRRSGGTTFAAVIVAYLSALVDYSGVLGVGEQATALLVAPTAKQAEIAFGRVGGIFDASPLLSGMVVNRTADSLELNNGVTVEVGVASYRSVRGLSLVCAVADEAAFLMSEGKNTDAELANALRPALITTRGLLVLSSTPYAPTGELHALHEKYYGKDDGAVLVARATSRDTNPTLAQSVIDRAIERDPVAARAEFMGEFRSDVSGFISRDMLLAAVDEGVTARPPSGGHVAFCDAASGVAENDGDSFTMAIGHADADGVVIIDRVSEWKPPFNASSVTAEVATILKEYGVDEVTSDGFSSGFLRAELSRNGIGHKISELSKSELYLASLPMLSSGRVRLLNHKVLIDQFAALERKPGTNGRDRIDARGHEDLANSVAGVVAMLSAGNPAPNILEFYRRQVEAAVAAEAAPPTLQAEHGHQAVMQIGARPHRPVNFVKVIVPSGREPSHVMGISGASYATEFENDTRVCWLSEADAMVLVGNPWANLEWHEANTVLYAELKAKRGPAPARGVRVVDLLQAADDARPRSPLDRGGIANDALRAMGRLG